MKKILFVLVSSAALVASAHHHHHFHRGGWIGPAVGFGIGLVTGHLMSQPRETVVVTPTFVTTQTSTVVPSGVFTPIVTTTINPNLPAFYQDPIPAPVRALPPSASTQVYVQPRVWVPGHFENQIQPNGVVIQVWVPGYYR